MMSTDSTSKSNIGMIAGLTETFKYLLALFVNRIELAILEFSEFSSAVFKLFFMCVFAILALLLSLGFLTAFIVALAWPIMGWKILLVFFIFFSLIAFGLAIFICHFIKRAPLAFAATMAELRRDRDILL